MKKTRAGSLLAPLRVRDFRLLFGGQLISTVGDAFYTVALPWLVLTNIIFITIIQQIIPRHLLGRVMGALMFASFGSYPLSVAIVGVVVEHLGPAIIFPAGGAVLFIAVVFGLFQKELREL